MKPDDPARISPTALYTSYVWYRNGLSHDALVTPTGRALHVLLRPMNAAYERLGQTSLDEMLLARHRVIDHLLERAIERGLVSQVLEVAAGFSPRGMRFAARYASRGLVYVEGDLPAQAERKRRALDGAGLRGNNHHIVALDALRDDGEHSIARVAAEHFEPTRGLAIVTEGLLGYFDRTTVLGMWTRFARTLRGFPHGFYFSDLNLSGDVGHMRGAKLFQFLLQLFARGQVHLHYDNPEEVAAAMRSCGFAHADVHSPSEFEHEVELPKRRRQLVRVLDAQT